MLCLLTQVLTAADSGSQPVVRALVVLGCVAAVTLTTFIAVQKKETGYFQLVCDIVNCSRTHAIGLALRCWLTGAPSVRWRTRVALRGAAGAGGSLVAARLLNAPSASGNLVG